MKRQRINNDRFYSKHWYSGISYEEEKIVDIDWFSEYNNINYVIGRGEKSGSVHVIAIITDENDDIISNPFKIREWIMEKFGEGSAATQHIEYLYFGDDR